MSLSDEDVQDIVRLLDDLDFDELHLRTRNFEISLRRTPGGWTQATGTLSAPCIVDPLPPGGEAVGGEAAGGEGTSRWTPADGGEAPRTRTGGGAGPRSEPNGETGGGERAQDPLPEGLVPVRAPLLGTFYRAPKPGAAPFVEVGGAVEEGTVVGIVETMKLMTSLYAGVCGRVAEICLADAAFAEQDAAVMLIAPDAT